MKVVCPLSSVADGIGADGTYAAFGNTEAELTRTIMGCKAVGGREAVQAKYFDAIGKSEDVLKMLNYVELSLGFDWTKELPQTTETSNPSSLQYALSDADYNFIRPHLSIDSKLYWSFCKDGNRAKQYRCPAE